MTHPVYRHPRWKAVRLAVLRRDGHRCQIKGPRCTGHATHVDHIVAFSDGGDPFDPSNLQAACRSCNLAKRNREVAAAARRDRGLAPAAVAPANTDRYGRVVPDTEGWHGGLCWWRSGHDNALSPHSDDHFGQFGPRPEQPQLHEPGDVPGFA